MEKKPNVVFVFGDQWRAQTFGYTGNTVVRTPHIDRLAEQSLNLTRAVSGCPVCSPARASLLTGQNPLTHGVFVNDVQLSNRAISIAEAFEQGGYDTAYIGKWHVDGRGRSNYIPPERRQGFDYWKVLECTHDYNQSVYYAGDSDQKLHWDGYDAIAQTEDAIDYIRQRSNHSESEAQAPFLLMLSWGPPHAPYQTAPDQYRQLYRPEDVILRPNVPESMADQARVDLAGYYAHSTALDDCIGRLLSSLDQAGIAEDTIFVFTSDHGDMLGSQGLTKKQKPWEESIRIPFLLRYPKLEVSRPGATTTHTSAGREVSDVLIDVPDFMPTLLGLADLPIPDTVEGTDYSAYFKATNAENPSDSTAFLACYHSFGQWRYGMDGGPHNYTGREFRGLRTSRYTYVRSLAGPWLLYDNETDPYQLNNLLSPSSRSNPEVAAELVSLLDHQLREKLEARNDKFQPGIDYIQQWGYQVDDRGTVPYTN